MFDLLACYGCNTLDQRHTFPDRIGNCFHSTDIIYHNANICRESAAWNLSAHDTFDQSFLSTLRVFGSCYEYFHVTDICNFFLHQFNGIRFVIFNDDNTFFSTCCLQDCF